MIDRSDSVKEMKFLFSILYHLLEYGEQKTLTLKIQAHGKLSEIDLLKQHCSNIVELIEKIFRERRLYSDETETLYALRTLLREWLCKIAQGSPIVLGGVGKVKGVVEMLFLLDRVRAY